MTTLATGTPPDDLYRELKLTQASLPELEVAMRLERLADGWAVHVLLVDPWKGIRVGEWESCFVPDGHLPCVWNEICDIVNAQMTDPF